MALKDWKKTSGNSKDLIAWKKNKKRIHVSKDTNIIWDVFGFNTPGLKRKEFKGKAKALKFAKTYMRTH